MKVAVLAITKNGLETGLTLRRLHPDWTVHAPAKFQDGSDISWYDEPTSSKLAGLFTSADALVCLFSLGAVVRLIAPLLKSKKTDPAVLVIDDGMSFVISALSGHIGGANELAAGIAKEIGATPVITTAADVNKTIAVDMVGRELGWRIEDDSNVTRISAMMVNGERIGFYQDAGSSGWWDGPLPGNVTVYGTLKEIREAGMPGNLIISDRIIDADTMQDAVLYRPPTLVVGIGLHRDTEARKILDGIRDCLGRFGLATKSVAALASIRKDIEVPGLGEAAGEIGVPVEYAERDELAQIRTPNPSRIVDALEGTPSVSEAAALLVSGGSLIVNKQKFPPDLTVAIARRNP